MTRPRGVRSGIIDPLSAPRSRSKARSRSCPAASADFGPGTYNSTDGNRASNLHYYGMPSNTSVNFNGNVDFQGVLYAPDADLTTNGGGKGLNYSGSSLSKSVRMNGAYQFHFDEALLNEGQPGYVIACWDEI